MTEEEALVDAFFEPSKKDRYKGFVRGARTRKKFLAELCHFRGLDNRFKYTIPGVQQTVEGIVALLNGYGAGDQCFVISDVKEIDGVRLSLEDAVGTVLGRTFGTFLSCEPGRLAYFENEDGRWILRRTS
ncbi:MAG TPA: hypothetical protein VJO53_07565 [Candidatus Acidoferrales bacterium]|nr:hypothetical protein [Candidatus Acidoferrales bacterium]